MYTPFRIAVAWFLVSIGSLAGATPPELRFGITPVFLDNQTAFLSQWREYLEHGLQRPVRFIQKSSYREIVEPLLGEQLDFAWICGYPYVRHQSALQLLSVPIYGGRPLYQSYLIVPASDRNTLGLADLRGRVFAYSDPDSNSGYLVTQRDLMDLALTDNTLFRRTFFTWSHSNVIRAVAQGLADGGAVDGYVWDVLARSHPELTNATRVVRRSETFGFPPLVARRSLPADTVAELRRVLGGMAQDATGRALLDQLLLDGFALPDPTLYQSIAEMARDVAARAH